WERYRQLPSRLPGYAAATIRAGACLELLTRIGEAVVTYEALASDFHRQGNEAMENGKAAVALAHHQAARRIRTWLVERGQQQASEPGLAASHARCGDAALLDGQGVLAQESYLRAAELLERLVSRGDDEGFVYAFAVARANLGNVALVAGDPEAALQWYGKAIEGLEPMSKAAGRPGLRSQLARASFNRGNALLGLQRLDAAIQDFTVAITLQAGEPDELALSFNNRGVARRARGDVNGAATDFEAALTALQSSMPSKSAPAESLVPEDVATHLEPRLRLDVVVGFSENAIEVLTRPRPAVRSSENERAVAVAVAARNRAYAALVQGQSEVALPHFENSASTYSSLVGREGQRDLTPQLAASFASLAWFLATQPESSLRRGARAREYAWQACELSEWKDFAPLDALAAACAETGDFAGAAKWQAKATDSAPAARKPELYARLRLYQSGTPYRAPKPRL
ncbi:MAG: hypothetical protein IT580_07210, partial [Verrucomicrobiales bacterium]|nr:hypothetical protein [Verrucomicrobiales bacterium]